MAFWSQNIEPQRQNRWKMIFSAASAANPTPANNVGVAGPSDLQNIVFALKSADKPSYKTNIITHKFANHNFKYPGRLEWNTIALKFASVTDPDAAVLLYNIILKAGYKNPAEIFGTNGINYSFLAKGREDGTPGDKGGFVPNISKDGVQLQMLDAAGTPKETWKIHSPFFTDVKFGGLDYGNDNIIDIECTMKFDWAELTLPEVGGQTGT